MLEEALEVTSTDIAKALHKTDTTNTPKPVRDDDELVVSASTIPDDAPEIGPSYVEETVEIGESYVAPIEDETTKQQDDILEHFEGEFQDEPETVVPQEDITQEPEEVLEEEMDDDENPQLDPVQQPEPKPVWTWYDNEEKRKRPKKSKKKRGKSTFDTDDEEPQKAPDFLLEEIPDEEETTGVDFGLPSKEKVDLNSFFEASKHQKKLKRSDRKKYSKRELKRRKKRQNKHIPDEIKDQRVFKFRKKKYKDVQEFITYLNDHYLDIDDVAHDVLADENFFGWVGKKSGVFPQSLAQFKQIKETIEKDE